MERIQVFTNLRTAARAPLDRGPAHGHPPGAARKVLAHVGRSSSKRIWAHLATGFRAVGLGGRARRCHHLVSFALMGRTIKLVIYIYYVCVFVVALLEELGLVSCKVCTCTLARRSCWGSTDDMAKVHS